MEISSLRPSKLQLKKKQSESIPNKTYWVLSVEDLRVLCLLSLIRKFNKKYRQVLKKTMERNSRKFKQISYITTSNINNSFDCIEPIDLKIETLKETHRTFLELKKNILGYLKLKKRQYIQRCNFLKTCSPNFLRCSDTNLLGSNYRNKQNEPLLGKKLTQVFTTQIKIIKLQSWTENISSKEKIKQEKCLKENQKTRNQQMISKNNMIRNMKNNSVPIYTNQSFEGNQIITDTSNNIDTRNSDQIQSTGNFMAKTYRYPDKKSANKFIERKKNQIYTFTRMNKTLQQCCLNNESTTSIQLLTVFTRTLCTIKNGLSANINEIVLQNCQFKQRIHSEIKMISKKFKESIFYFIEITKHYRQISKPLIKRTYSEQFVQKDETEQNQILQQIRKFIKLCTQLAEFTKNLLISPNFSLIIRGKGKILEKLIPLFTQIRYASNYLNKQIENMDYQVKKNLRKSCKPETKIAEKWRHAYIKKYRSNHTKKIRL